MTRAALSQSRINLNVPDNKSTAKQGNIHLFTILQGYPNYTAEQRYKICGLLQMYSCYVATWLRGYGVKKDRLNKSMGSNSETEKGRTIFFVGDTPS